MAAVSWIRPIHRCATALRATSCSSKPSASIRSSSTAAARPLPAPQMARGADGKIYNCNADEAAAQAAVGLKARRLVFMSDVPGLMRDATDPKSVISHLQVEEVGRLRKAGVIDKGMIPKVSGAVAALKA